MKNKILFLSLLFLTSCREISEHDYNVNKQFSTYTQSTVDSFNILTPPIILLSKEKTTFGYNVSVMDSKGKVQVYGDLSSFGCSLGETYNKRDTLRK